MTICISGICDDGKKAFVITDKMLTDEDLSIEYEHYKPKIIQISDNCLAIFSGSPTAAEEILEPVIKEYATKSPSIADIAEAVKQSYFAVRKRRIEELYFKGRGLTIEEFHKNQSNLNLRVVEGLEKVIDEYEFPGELEIVVAGVDKKAHVFLIENPGISTPYNYIGWCCIGSGQPHAESIIISNEYSTSLNLQRAIFICYEAKKQSELAPGVGNKTDIAVIDSEGVHYILHDKKEELERIYTEKKNLITPVNDNIYKRVENLKLW